MDDVVRQRKAVLLPADLETALGRLERGLKDLNGGALAGPGALRLLRARGGGRRERRRPAALGRRGGPNTGGLEGRAGEVTACPGVGLRPVGGAGWSDGVPRCSGVVLVERPQRGDAQEGKEVDDLLAKSERPFAAAELLLGAGDADFAASRAYYGYFLRRPGAVDP